MVATRRQVKIVITCLFMTYLLSVVYHDVLPHIEPVIHFNV